ncbi:MAG: LON peptidase substrate-binding domain-containing protein [Chloroflexota bacterium]
MEIPLFPLHTVLAPGIALPLHVFEERYRVMVRRCLDSSSPFGVVLIREGSEVAPAEGEEQELSIAGVGTFAEIREASRFSDGRWRLLVVGGGRFLVREVHAEREPYLVAEVEPLSDEVGRPAIARALVGRVTRRFVDYLRLLQPRDGEAADPIDVQVEVDVPERAAEAAGESGESGESGEGASGDRGEGDAGVETPDGAPRSGPGDLASALRIPDDPSTLSFLLTGIVQVEPDRRQALLEAATAEERLRELDELLDRELLLLGLRLAPFTPDRGATSGRAN